ncbi:UPF0739 protein C1orf74 homolog [Haliotis asinina]|uniref:UPF0739 protein C1orf74 homolog n=1 Tax=Haliotis asinina TaxID=109174 RepID=UPI00353183E5
MSWQQDIFQWKDLLQATFKRKHVKKWQEMILDILVVDSGFKPGLLWDYGKLDSESLEHLLKRAKERFLLKNTLSVVAIEMDVMILNLDSLRGHHSVSCLDNMKVVDVSFELQQPESMNDKSRLQTTYQEYKQIIYDKKNRTCLQTNIFNPSSLFGLLLGYPVIYWYSMEDEASGNCLSLQPLTTYRVVGCCHDNLGEHIKQTFHIVYSFSVPVCVLGCYAQYISKWFQELVDTGRWSQWFDGVTLEEDTVTLPCVCL